MHACANGEEPYEITFPSLLTMITIEHVDDPSASLRVVTYTLEKRANTRATSAQHHISILLMLQEKLVKSHTWSEAGGLVENEASLAECVGPAIYLLETGFGCESSRPFSERIY